ncbi:MAG: hypothetical protein PVG78_03925 [Desulfobacterales bacterium]
MDRQPIGLIRLLGIAVIFAFAAGCSKPSYIDVRYGLPAPSDALSGTKVALRVMDERPDRAVFAGDAKEEFEYFTGIYSLSVGEEDRSHVIGTYELPGLLAEAFRQRLTALGVEVVTPPAEGVPLVEIVLRRFQIEGAGHKWLADVSYEARLVIDGNLRATQNVAGNAERTRLMGPGGAEKVIGEIFTDSVNKFDLQKLMNKAGMP